MKILRILLYVSLLGTIITGGLLVYWTNQTEDHAQQAEQLQEKVEDPYVVSQVLGAAYMPSGDRLVIATHYGLRMLQNGQWLIPPGEPRMYTGLQWHEQGFFASGRTLTGQAANTPLGLVYSDDLGITLEPIALHGEVQWRALAASLRQPSLYVINDVPNELMSERGLYVSHDRGVHWQLAAAEHLEGMATGMTVAPDDGQLVVVSTTSGLYVSQDAAQSFVRWYEQDHLSAATFAADGSLWFVAIEETANQDERVQRLFRLPTAINADLLDKPLTRDALQEISLPNALQSAIVGLAIDPQAPEQRLALLVRGEEDDDVYVTNDRGESWQHVVVAGQAKDVR